MAFGGHTILSTSSPFRLSERCASPYLSTDRSNASFGITVELIEFIGEGSECNHADTTDIRPHAENTICDSIYTTSLRMFPLRAYSSIGLLSRKMPVSLMHVDGRYRTIRLGLLRQMKDSSMSKSNRITVRQVPQISVSDKNFRKVVDTEKRVRVNPAHPSLVAADLEKGSLKSLARYMRETGGIADAEVRQLLLQMIDGRSDQTSFRIIVVKHPDAPPDVGGRPKTKSLKMSLGDEALLNRLNKLLTVARKPENAIDDLEGGRGTSRATVFRAKKKKKQMAQHAANAMLKLEELQRTDLRRKAALAQLKRRPN